jgi:hypothetical protein
LAAPWKQSDLEARFRPQQISEERADASKVLAKAARELRAAFGQHESNELVIGATSFTRTPAESTDRGNYKNVEQTPGKNGLEIAS